MNPRVRILLVLSLVLNALLFGVALGELSYRFGGPSSFSYSASPPVDPMAQLSAKTRTLYEANLKRIWADVNAGRSKITEKKKHALELLAKEPFDEKAYLGTVKEINVIHNAMKQRLAEEIVSLAKESSQAERVILADIVARNTPTPTIPMHCASHMEHKAMNAAASKPAKAPQ